MYHKDSIMDARKIDWILLNKRMELRKIMKDNGNNTCTLHTMTKH